MAGFRSRIPSADMVFSLAYWSKDGANFYASSPSTSLGNNVNNCPQGLMRLALYSNSTTGMYFSHRQGIHSDGTLMDTEWIGNGVITNSNLHAGARVLAAGAAPQPLKQ